MVATFVVEDGTGLATANAYVSEADADQYHENFGNPASWTAATSAAKQAAIREATQYLDNVYVLRWKGFRGKKTQLLDWPRRSVVDPSGWAVDNDSVPPAVKDATSVLALRVIDGDTLQPDIAAGDTGISRERVKVDVIEEDKTYLSSKPVFKKYTVVNQILRPLLERRNKLERG